MRESEIRKIVRGVMDRLGHSTSEIIEVRRRESTSYVDYEGLVDLALRGSI